MMSNLIPKFETLYHFLLVIYSMIIMKPTFKFLLNPLNLTIKILSLHPSIMICPNALLVLAIAVDLFT